MRRVFGILVACALAATGVLAVAGVVELLTPQLSELAGRAPRQTEPWPDEAGEVAYAAALVLVLFSGLVATLRFGLARLRGPARPPTEGELARLVSEARTDSLTKLGNRRAFQDDLAAEIERRNRSGSVFSLMAIDLDGLKRINDTHGHQAGDAHLRTIAAQLDETAGSLGTAYRTGGDEFMVLLPGRRNWHAIELAHRIQAATTASGGVRALSIGVTETRGMEHRQELVRQADLALYEAKREKLPVVPYQPALEAPDQPSEALDPQKKALATALARAVDSRDSGTGGHSEVVAELATAIGSRQGLGRQQLERLRVAALLHDVGKIAVPDAILHKSGRLAPEEREAMRQHVVVGRDILVAAGFSDEATWLLHHHERHDGSGYPDALRGDAIPLESRIIAVADAFEAMTGGRPYRPQLTDEEALAELSERSGTQFDPDCVQALAAVVRGRTRVSAATVGI
jgi:diguanylate cyclase (GGDEF)-like protein/putative nucleotidyltransferase with HDIG domain